MQVVFVCTGNTCRSPMAEGILKNMYKYINVSSRGLYVPDACAPSYGSIAAMEKMDIDIKAHRSKQLTYADCDDADLIITMTEGHKKTILEAAENCRDKTYTLAEFAGDEGDISDPYGKDDNAYYECAKRIYALILKADWGQNS